MISSNDTTISAPTVTVKGDKGESIDRSTIEIVYNCDQNKMGAVKITLHLTPDNCKPFKLAWKKICKEKGNYLIFIFKGHVPKVNIGVTPKSTEIMSKGVAQSSFNVFNSNTDKFIIKKEINSFPLYLSYAFESVFIFYLERKTNVRASHFL
jgi:hypothetical protein